MSGIIQTVTPNLSTSIDFYTRLGFTHYEQGGFHYVSDEHVTVRINTERTSRAGLVLNKTDWSQELSSLKHSTKIYNCKDGHVLSTPGPLWVYLENSLTTPKPGNIRSKSLLGNYAGISIECTETQHAAEILKVLGFEQDGGDINGGWFSMRQNQTSVSLMQPNNCPHLFFNPSLTYFNGENNLEVIRKIKEAQIEITEEINVFNPDQVVDNILIRDPGGLGFFVFSD